MNTVEIKLKELMRERGLTQIQLSELSGVSRPYISQLIAGKHYMRVDIACMLCKALGCSLDELIKFK